MTIQWWQMLSLIAFGTISVIVAVLVGGWLVFRSKTITMPAQFFNPVKQPKGGSNHYVPASLSEFPLEAEEISSEAARLRAQKTVPPGGRDAALAFVKGLKK